MDLRRLTCAALVVGAAALAGCHTPFKAEPAEPVKSSPAVLPAPTPVVAAPAPAPTNPTDPMGRLRAFIANDGLAGPPEKAGQAARLTAAWNNKVIYAPDPTHGGDPVPGLMARLWLFGPDTKDPLSLEGELFLGAWDMSPKATGGQPVLLEVWHIDPEAARKFRRPDFVGDGYTVFLPWSNYHVDLKQINVMARFNGADGRSLVSSPETLTLDHSATLQRAAERLAGLSNGGPAKAEVKLPEPLPINFPEAPRK
jgi:hypothetical protein